MGLRSNLRKHPFLLALRRWGRFLAAKSEEKRMFSQATSVQSFVPYKAFQAGLSTHINSGVYSQKRYVVLDRLILRKRNFPPKYFPNGNTESRSAGT